MNAISLQNLTKRYRSYGGPSERLKEVLFGSRPKTTREFVALDDVTLTVPAGSTLGLIGPNGAGKSTLLKVLAGIIEPSSGTVSIEGKVASIIELGAGFHPDFTGRENVFLNAALHGFDEAHVRESYEEIARFSELGQYLEMPVRTYSSGMFVRLAFAVAISARPDVLLIDEALAVGDAVFAHRCLARIREMHERGVTIVFVSHDTNAIVSLCDRAIFLQRGRIAADGLPKDVVHEYLLSVAERLTALKENADVAASFHQVGAVETTGSSKEKRFGSFEARIVDLGIRTASASQLTQITAGEQAEFWMNVRFDRPVLNPVFGIMFRNRMGVEVFGTNTHIRKQSTGSFEAGETATVTITLPVYIGAGTYSISFAVHTADGHFFDYRVDTLTLEVIGATDTIGVAALPATLTVTRGTHTTESPDALLERLYADAPSRLPMDAAADRYISGHWFAAQETDGRWCRWLGKNGLVYLRIPEKATELVIEAKTYYPEIATTPISVTVRIESQPLISHNLAQGDWQDLTVEIPPELRGRLVPVHLNASLVWVPREYNHVSTDTRELSILVSEFSFR